MTLPRFSRKEVRQFADELVANGFACEGQNARGHWLFTHPASTEQLELPETPGGHSWKMRKRAQADRMRGVEHQGKARQRKAVKMSGFRLDAPAPSGALAATARTESIAADYESARAELERLSTARSREAAQAARSLIARIARLEEALQAHHQPCPVGSWLITKE